MNNNPETAILLCISPKPVTGKLKIPESGDIQTPQISTKRSPEPSKHTLKTKFTQTSTDFHKSKISEKDPKLF